MILPEYSHKSLDKEKFLNKLIDEELILREAQKLNLHEKEDYKNRVEAFKRELLVDLYLQQYLKERNTKENQKKYYEEKKEKYMSPEMVRISIILVKTEDEAKEILKKVQEGEDFAGLARRYSKDSSAEKGGDFGFRAKKALRKEFADAAFSMKTGEISSPIKTGDGYFIIKVTDYREKRIATFEEVEPEVASEYTNKILVERISELRKAVSI
jgi:parvulin-like peptidyl-prolyl isomerase